MRAKDLAAFIREREAVRVRKEAGKPRPWTKDPILAKYRFCNVHREHDKVSRWLRENWYDTFNGPDAWFAAVVARLLNNTDSLWAVKKTILPFKPVQVAEILHKRALHGFKNFNPAYIVSTNGIAMNKVDYLVARVLKPLWANRKVMAPQTGSGWTLERYHARLMKFDGLGSFIAAQVVADLKYMEPFKDAEDWWTFASSGPGSRRGLNRVLERDPNTPWREMDWRMVLEELADKAGIKAFGLHAQDLQNCLCEFDKYERARLGEGTPKQIYKEVE